MNRAVILLLAMACTYQPAKLDVAGCDADCAGDCVAGECVLPVGAQCTADDLCAEGACVCADPDCGSHVCSALACDACSYESGATCSPVDDDVPCTLADSCTAVAACQSGSCTEMRARSCKDDNACTSDACTEQGCRNPVLGECRPRYFSYHRKWAAFVVDVPIPPMLPALVPVGGTTITVSDLPAGLELNADTGEITGTPTQTQDFQTYTFTATTDSTPLSRDTVMDIQVLDGFVVNSSADTSDAMLDGICDTGTNACSLRAAVEEANTDPVGGVAIYISPAAGEPDLTEGPIVVTSKIVVYGHDSGTSISASANTGRHFDVTGSSSSLWVSDLWLKHGRADGAAAIHAGDYTDLHLQRCRLQDNRNTANNSVLGEQAGAVHATWSSFVDMLFCTAEDNRNTSAGTGPGVLSLQDASATLAFNTFDSNRGQHGGVVRIHGDGQLTVESNFFRDNEASAPNGDGGAIDAGAGACQLVIVNNTIVDNRAEEHGAAVYSSCGNPAQLLHNTIVGNGGNAADALTFFNSTANAYNNVLANPLPECNGSGGIAGFGNLVGDDSCSLSAADNHTLSLAAMALEEPADNLGPTPSIRPTADSPAVDSAEPGWCSTLNVDQRGFVRRPTTCDIGAVELQ